jgi:hypothetical protein
MQTKKATKRKRSKKKKNGAIAMGSRARRSFLSKTKCAIFEKPFGKEEDRQRRLEFKQGVIR